MPCVARSALDFLSTESNMARLTTWAESGGCEQETRKMKLTSLNTIFVLFLRHSFGRGTHVGINVMLRVWLRVFVFRIVLFIHRIS